MFDILQKKLKTNTGQSILEFALILPFVMFFIFIHLQLCISYIAAEYTNYVSFMSARSVLTNGHLNDRYKGVVNRYVPPTLKRLLKIDQPRLIRWNPETRSFDNGNNVVSGGPQLYGRELGVEIEYSIPVFVPFVRELGENLRFKTTTVLGREPYHGDTPVDSTWSFRDPAYGDSFGQNSACTSQFNDNGC